MIFLNSSFVQDAGCPIFPMEFMEDIQVHADNLDYGFLDLNLYIYKKLGSYKKYADLKCIAGGYTVSYRDANEIKLSTYRYEAVPTLSLLISILYSDNLENEICLREIKGVALEYGMDFEEIKHLIHETNDILDEFVEVNINNIMNEKIVVNMSSVASVFIGLWVCKKIKDNCEAKNILAVGNQINIPEVAEFAIKCGIVDNILNSKIRGKEKYSLIEVLERLKLQSEEYPLYQGLKIVPYELSHGCPAKCNFCTERLNWDSDGSVRDCYEKKDIDRCIDEIEYLISEYKVSGLTFNDCMLNLKDKKYEKLIDFLKEKNIFLSGSLRIDFIDDEMIKLLDELNFTNLIIGLETVNKKSVDVYQKGNEEYSDNAKDIISKLMKHGILPQINIIIDHPYESEKGVLDAIEDIKLFARGLNEENTQIVDISLGEILVNYPSETYFKIEKDDNFEIIFNRTPDGLEDKISEGVKNSVSRIPLKVHRKNKSHVNKNEVLLDILKIKSKNQVENIKAHLNVLLKHRKKFIEEWNRRDIQCVKKGSIRNLQRESEGATKSEVVNKVLQMDNPMSLSKLLDEDDNIAEIFVLQLLGLIDFRRKDNGRYK